ncbi:MAG: endonuclease III [Hyphomicrobium sp.]|uniref:endonuclease III n=1 Tax=Hyphomicrobium sp. TaxID=82 RepID=UPI00132C15B9|nr:endonuclease III [Hyphomicrobium sp.]KAB2944056.1 MAG: endonuclease III [Hyphomicrobium sp.]MBZ0209349.1 endonuclease III [Hyphomicrobium sp.]
MKSLDRSASRAKPGARKRQSPTAVASRRAGRRTRLSKPAIAEIFRRFEAADPHPKSELEYVNPFTLLVAVVLSAQATDAGVNKATRALFQIADTPEKMVQLGEDGIREFVKTIGLYRNKARNVLELSRQLVANHGGSVPRDRAALEALPGVGRKTANVILNVAFGEPTMAVDTHVFRVANRTGLSSGRTPLEVEEDLLRVVPAEFAIHAHHWLILHGRYVCKARRPECPRCIIRDLCLFEAKTPCAE